MEEDWCDTGCGTSLIKDDCLFSAVLCAPSSTAPDFYYYNNNNTCNTESAVADLHLLLNSSINSTSGNIDVNSGCRPGTTFDDAAIINVDDFYATSSIATPITIKREPRDDYFTSVSQSQSPSSSTSTSSSNRDKECVRNAHSASFSQDRSDASITSLSTSYTNDSGCAELHALPPVSHFSHTAHSEFLNSRLQEGAESSPSSNRSSPTPPTHAEHANTTRTRSKMHEMAVRQRLITDQDPRGIGFLQLSAEEKRTLLQEGYALPTRLPLSKSEEEALKIVRRKIKNKLSAQESRRKRKEYMDTLEQKVQSYFNENSNLKHKVKHLEQSNRNLMMQLKKLQARVEMQNVNEHPPCPTSQMAVTTEGVLSP